MARMRYKRFAGGHGELPLDAEQPYLPEEEMISVTFVEPDDGGDRKPRSRSLNSVQRMPSSPKGKSPTKKSLPAVPTDRTLSVTSRQLSVRCPGDACLAVVVKITLISGAYEWELDRDVMAPTWRSRPDPNAVFELTCSRGHKTARKRKSLPKRLLNVMS